jgi:hypothetical protein
LGALSLAKSIGSIWLINSVQNWGYKWALISLRWGVSELTLPPQESDGISNGMQTMTHRTTFALDGTTASRLRRLSALWQVSQAEVVRRSLEQAEKQAEIHKPDPVAMLRRLHENGGGLDRAQAEAYLAEVYQDRKKWRGL